MPGERPTRPAPPSAGTEFRIGCSSWTSPAWTGRFYPPGTPDGQRLPLYARAFDTVEVDATYYAAPSPSMVRGWARRTPDSFRFALKMPRDLLDPKHPERDGSVAPFVDSARGLGEKLGPILLQFAPWFRAPKAPGGGTAAFLAHRLDTLPPGPRYAVELRERGWFEGPTGRWLEEELRSRAIASCWSSLTYVEVPPLTTVDWVYLRFIGDHETIPADQHGEVRVDRRSEMERWIDRVRAATPAHAFVFFNNHFEGYGPASANRFREALGLPAVPFPNDPGGPDAPHPSRGLDAFVDGEDRARRPG
jgi:uncharacterized protein YecE (DUF72 family)